MSDSQRSANLPLEPVYRIEPTALESIPPDLADTIADLAREAAILANALHPRTAESLADLVRIMNAYYSNLIEGHNTRPSDIERALSGDFDSDDDRRDLQLEAAAHVRVQRDVDRLAADGSLPEPASQVFLRELHRDFFKDAPERALLVGGRGGKHVMLPGAWRSEPSHDVIVGRHQPPSSTRVDDFMRYFERRYRLTDQGSASRIVAMAAAHHRFNYIHPFADGNGRVSRLMSHAMGHVAGIGAHGLWSVSRGLARGLDDRDEYKRLMDATDAPRTSDLDGRGNLSQRALLKFVRWFVRVCLDQVRFMSGLFEFGHLQRRLRLLVERSDSLRPETAALLVDVAARGEIARGDAARITGLPERSARRVLDEALKAGLLASASPKGVVFLRFTQASSDVLFPRLFAGS